MRTRRGIRAAVATAMLSAAAMLLTGCFVIPLVDGRSPFDDPFGPSFGAVEAQHEPVRSAAEEALGDAFTVAVETDSDNCEGPCDLRLGLDIGIPAGVDYATMPAFDVTTLRRLVEAVAPIAAGARLDLTISTDRSAEEFDEDFIAVAEELVRTDESGGGSAIWVGWRSLTMRSAEHSADEILDQLR